MSCPLITRLDHPKFSSVDPSGRAVWGVGLQPLALCGYGLQCCCLSLVSAVLSGRGLCDGLITRPKESYRVWCVVPECDLEASKMRKPRTTRGCCAMEKLFSIIYVLSCRLRRSFERTILMQRNLFWQWCIHRTWVADGTHQISTNSPLLFKYLSHLVTRVYLPE
jgi:hypothetical protein